MYKRMLFDRCYQLSFINQKYITRQNPAKVCITYLHCCWKTRVQKICNSIEPETLQACMVSVEFSY